MRHQQDEVRAHATRSEDDGIYTEINEMIVVIHLFDVVAPLSAAAHALGSSKWGRCFAWEGFSVAVLMPTAITAPQFVHWVDCGPT